MRSREEQALGQTLPLPGPQERKPGLGPLLLLSRASTARSSLMSLTPGLRTEVAPVRKVIQSLKTCCRSHSQCEHTSVRLQAL